MLKTGDQAPDFTLPDENGAPFHLYTELKKAKLVLFFYPKDNTPGCTAEACKFRDEYDLFLENGAAVAGISSDGFTSHSRFRNKYRLPFSLLSDSGREVARLFGVPAFLGLFSGRVSFVIDHDGRILHVFQSQFNPEKHVDEALRVLRNQEG